MYMALFWILPQRLYHKNDGMSHPFRSTVRLSVVMDILKAPTRLGGAGLKPDKMKHNGEILGLFPKHCECETRVSS